MISVLPLLFVIVSSTMAAMPTAIAPRHSTEFMSFEYKGITETQHVTFWPAKISNMEDPRIPGPCILVVNEMSPAQLEENLWLENKYCDFYKIRRICQATWEGTQCKQDPEILAQFLWFNPKGLQLPRGTRFFVEDSALYYPLSSYLRTKDANEKVGSLSYLGERF